MPVPSPSIVVEEIDDWSRIAPLREEWNELLAASRSDTLFLRHEWLETWWRSFGAGRRPAVFLARTEGRLVAALPLLEEQGSVTGLRVTQLHSMTNGHSFRFNAIVREGDEPALAAIWEAVSRRSRPWTLILLEDVPEDASALEPFLRAARAGGAAIGIWRSAEVPYLPTEGSWSDYHAGLSKNMRANLRKKARRLSEEGTVTFRCIQAPGDVPEALRVGLPLEGSGWKARDGSAILSDPVLTEFYTRWAEIAAAQGWLRLSFLDVDGVPVAFDFSTLYHGRYYDLKMGYHPEWERFSVGQLLKAHILESCFESEAREYDFLGVSMRAKDDWLPRKRGHDWYFIFRPSLRGRALHALKFGLVPAVKRVLGR